MRISDWSSDVCSSDLATNIQIPQTSGVPNATTLIDLTVSLPANADLPADRPVYTAANPYTFDRLDPNSYNHSTQTTVYDSAGNPISETVYYTRTGDATPSTWSTAERRGGKECGSTCRSG